MFPLHEFASELHLGLGLSHCLHVHPTLVLKNLCLTWGLGVRVCGYLVRDCWWDGDCLWGLWQTCEEQCIMVCGHHYFTLGSLVWEECLEFSGLADAGGGFVGADLLLHLVMGVNLNSLNFQDPSWLWSCWIRGLC